MSLPSAITLKCEFSVGEANMAELIIWLLLSSRLPLAWR